MYMYVYVYVYVYVGELWAPLFSDSVHRARPNQNSIP